MTGLATSLVFRRAPLAVRGAYALLLEYRHQLTEALAVCDAAEAVSLALSCSRDEAAALLEAMRAAHLVSQEGLDLLVVPAAPVAVTPVARATRAVSASPAPAATDVPGDLRERLVAALDAGATYRGLARVLGCSESTLRMFATGARTLPARLVAPLAAHIESAQGVRTTPAHKVCAHCAHPSSSPSDSSPEAQNQKKNPESESGSDAREGAHTAHGAHKDVRTVGVRTTQETPEARERRERWERCEEALMREGGRAVDLRGGAQHKLVLRRLCEQAGYTEADCAALGRYLADRPSSYPLPKWIKDRGPVVGLATLTREFKVEGEVLAELMCSARLWAEERERLRRAREEAAERAARPRYVPDAKALLTLVFGEGGAPSERKALRAAG